jgi:hypothetical protein
MIQPEGRIGDRLALIIHRSEVRIGKRVIGSRRKRCSRIDFLSQRTFARDRNLVIGKRRALIGTGLCGVRIVDNLLDTLAVDQSAEIAVSHRHRGHPYQLVGGLPLGETSEGEKEERLVFAAVNFGDADRPPTENPHSLRT